MRFVVNKNCIGCGMCTVHCPEVFSLNEEHVSQAVEGEIPQDLENAAMSAFVGCPVSAIEIIE